MPASAAWRSSRPSTRGVPSCASSCAHGAGMSGCTSAGRATTSRTPRSPPQAWRGATAWATPSCVSPEEHGAVAWRPGGA
eukprot:1281400-Lingulodinium_polyedra.AAC.1